MKNNERLLNTIGEIDEKFISKKNIRKKHNPIKWAAVGSALCAAAIIGFIITRILQINDIDITDSTSSAEPDNSSAAETALSEETVGEPPEETAQTDYSMFPESDYSQKETFEGTETVFCGIRKNFELEWGYVPKKDSTSAENAAELDGYTPWSDDSGITSMPVFKNLSYSDNNMEVTRYFTDEQMLNMAETAAKLLEADINNTEFDYEGETNQVTQFRHLLRASCSSEKYDFEIKVYSDGAVVINFLNPMNKDFFQLPDGYKLGKNLGSAEEGEKALGYIAEAFENILQIENPVLSVGENYRYFSELDNEVYINRDFRIYSGSDDTVKNILNRSLNFAYISGVDDRLYSITLANRLSVSEYIGNYPLISAEKAKEMLLKGAYVTGYLTPLYDEDMKIEEKVTEEDVKTVELIYRCDNCEYFLPYYRFFVEARQPSYLKGTNLNRYFAYYVPAIDFDYVNFGFELPDLNDEIIPAYPNGLITLPDGTEISKTEAFKAYGTTENPILEFDFGFLRYAEPIFDNNIDDPDCYNFKTDSFVPSETETSDPKYFKVQEGTILDNGLKVTKARYRVIWDNGQKYYSNIVEFNETKDDTIFKGILRLFTEDDDDYNIEAGDMYFYPDPSGDVRIPVLYTDSENEGEPISFVDNGNTALRTDGGAIYVGNFNYAPLNDPHSVVQREIFRYRNCVKVKLDLIYIVFSDYENAAAKAEAKIIGCQPID